MTDDEFTEQLWLMRETMYRVSYTHLQRSCDRDDAVQETLLKAWKNRHRMRDARYMQTWVIRILINECHNIGRSHKHETADPIPEQAVFPDSAVELRAALFSLNEKLRLPVVLHYIEGYHVREISLMLGVPKGTVLWRMSKARKELSAMLDSGTQDVANKISQQEG